MAQNLGVPSVITRSRAGRLRTVWALTFALTFALAWSGRVQARGDDATEARRHAQRASNLAASGKCRQAVAEWNKAMAILRDPALLFNRAECYRKLGDVDSALEDYRQFLSDMPKAPNRGEVERRIAELSAPKEKEKEKAPPPPTAVVATPPPAPLVARPVAPSPPAPHPVAPAEPAPQEAAAPPALPAAPSEPASNPALTLAAPAETAPSGGTDGGIATRPWFWITVAAVAVAAGVGAFVFLSRDSTNVPPSALGNYKL